jgi:hypothetical protein
MRAIRLSGRLLIALAVAGTIAVGIWGLAAPRGAHRPVPAAIGDTVRVPGGLIRVVRVNDVSYDMLPMTGPGMNMSAAHGGMPKISDGYRRFSVELLLYADPGSSLQFRSRDFRVGRSGLKGSPPVVGFGRTVVKGGVAVSRSLEYQVPEASKGLALSVPGADRAVLLAVPAGAGHHHH